MHVLIIIVLMFFYSCSTSQEVISEPKNNNSSILAVSIDTRAQYGSQILNPTKVFFIYLNDNENIGNGKNYITSNYYNEDMVYLLDAKPGRYIAVASDYRKFSLKTGGMYSEFNFYGKDIIEASEIIVKPGKFNYMGKIIMQSKAQNLKDLKENGDEIQKHYSNLLYNYAEVRASRNFLNYIQNNSLIRLQNDKVDKDIAIEKSKLYLKDSGWKKLLNLK